MKLQLKPWRKLAALFAVPLSVLCFVPSCSTHLPAPTVEWALDEEADIFEEDVDVEPEGEPDDSIPDPLDEHWSLYATEPPAQARSYSCPSCDKINCASSTPERREDFGLLTIKAATHIFGGMGNDRGTISSLSVYLNCGIRKKLDIGNGTAEPMLYVWYAPVSYTELHGMMQPITKQIRLSGWMPECALEQSFNMKTRVNPKRRFNNKVYRFGGPKLVAQLAKKYDKLRIAQHGDENANLLSHYLAQPDTFGNWVMNVTQGIPGQGNGPGHSNDSYTIFEDRVKNPKPTGTHPSSIHPGEQTMVKVQIYTAKDKDHPDPVPWTGCSNPPCKATFMYVKVRGRYGWVPSMMFTKRVSGVAANVPPEDGGPTCGSESTQCCNGVDCDPGLICATGTCVSCGAVGEPCCSGDVCIDGLCNGGSCTSCGSLGEACCADSTCDLGMCDGVTCVGCGSVNEACCGGACSTDRLNCNGVCQSCGDPKQACCVAGAPCNVAGTGCYAGTCGGACYARCIDGTLQGPYAASISDVGADCKSWSDAACANHYGKGRVELDKKNIFDSGTCGALDKLCCGGDVCNSGLKCRLDADLRKSCQKP